ncbi:hypothetical protein CXZ05_13605 [Arthrobacter sp. AFG20]|nr:hypothetical protein CXZ05_13605 [Arthrobacter sp. AFG20]SLK04618.1 hypothetical protein SAMN06272721_10527 [Arthrobacter sp. P2b]
MLFLATHYSIREIVRDASDYRAGGSTDIRSFRSGGTKQHTDAYCTDIPKRVGRASDYFFKSSIRHIQDIHHVFGNRRET